MEQYPAFMMDGLEVRIENRTRQLIHCTMHTNNTLETYLECTSIFNFLGRKYPVDMAGFAV